MGKTKIYNLWITLQTSFWFLPTLMILVLFCMSFVTLRLDQLVDYHQSLSPFEINRDSILDVLLAVGPEGARATLMTVASSMISVAGVTFSITIVALTLAASQLGPGLLRNFMQDKSTQFVLGSFSSTFVYCLLILRSIQSTAGNIFVPTLSVTISVVLAILNVGVLIFFIHHISVSLKAESVIVAVYTSLIADIDRIFSDISPDEKDSPESGKTEIVQRTSGEYSFEKAFNTERSGYIQAIDHEILMGRCSESDWVMELTVKAGDFTVAGSRIATIYAASEVQDDALHGISDAFILGYQRTPEQDVEYAIHQMVEIGVRSLSPGINDPFTAISCIDYLSSTMCSLSKKQLPSPHCCDSNEQLRLILKTYTFGGLLDSAFNQLRQHSRSSVAVTIRLMDAFIRIAEGLRDDSHKEQLMQHAKVLRAEADRYLKEEHDRADFEERYQKCVSLLR